jgi:hypothetical protein
MGPHVKLRQWQPEGDQMNEELQTDLFIDTMMKWRATHESPELTITTPIDWPPSDCEPSDRPPWEN